MIGWRCHGPAHDHRGCDDRACACPCHQPCRICHQPRHSHDGLAHALAWLGLPPIAGGALDANGWHRADCKKRYQCARCPNWPEWGWWRDGEIICNACHGDPPDALTAYDRRLPVEVQTSAGRGDCD